MAGAKRFTSSALRFLVRSVTAHRSVLRVPTKTTPLDGPTAMCRASGTTAYSSILNPSGNRIRERLARIASATSPVCATVSISSDWPVVFIERMRSSASSLVGAARAGPDRHMTSVLKAKGTYFIGTDLMKNRLADDLYCCCARPRLCGCAKVPESPLSVASYRVFTRRLARRCAACAPAGLFKSRLALINHSAKPARLCFKLLRHSLRTGCPTPPVNHAPRRRL